MHWFKSSGLIYRPVSAIGWSITVAAAAFCVQVFIGIDRQSHSASDTLIGVFPYWALTFLLWAWVAGRASAPR